MPRKSIIMLGMIVGSYAGGYIPVLFGVSVFSLIAVLGGLIGGILGIWIAYRLS